MRIKTADLIGPALDWAMAKSEYDELAAKSLQYPQYAKHLPTISPSTAWAQGGPIIEREGITLRCGLHGWDAELEEFDAISHGPTPLIAAMRCLVASRLGDEVDVPEELL